MDWRAWWEDLVERGRAMAIVAAMTLPAFGVRAYQTRELKDGYGASEPDEREERDVQER